MGIVQRMALAVVMSAALASCRRETPITECSIDVFASPGRKPTHKEQCVLRGEVKL